MGQQVCAKNLLGFEKNKGLNKINLRKGVFPYHIIFLDLPLHYFQISGQAATERSVSAIISMASAGRSCINLYLAGSLFCFSVKVCGDLSETSQSKKKILPTIINTNLSVCIPSSFLVIV